MNWHKRHGFTIVELLIVIVVIAILAAITIVAFNGVQQRAANSSKKAAVQSISKLISLYRTEHNGEYPSTATTVYCLTTDSECRTYAGNDVTADNTALLAALRSYGSIPATSGDATAVNGPNGGITYMYSSARTLDGVSNTFVLLYWLNGTNQDCRGIGGMVSVADSGTPNDLTPAARSRADTGTNQTRCYLMFPNQ